MFAMLCGVACSGETEETGMVASVGGGDEQPSSGSGNVDEGSGPSAAGSTVSSGQSSRWRWQRRLPGGAVW